MQVVNHLVSRIVIVLYLLDNDNKSWTVVLLEACGLVNAARKVSNLAEITSPHTSDTPFQLQLSDISSFFASPTSLFSLEEPLVSSENEHLRECVPLCLHPFTSKI